MCQASLETRSPKLWLMNGKSMIFQAKVLIELQKHVPYPMTEVLLKAVASMLHLIGPTKGLVQA